MSADKYNLGKSHLDGGTRARFLGLTMVQQEKRCTHGLGDSSKRCLSCTINAAAAEISRLEAQIAALQENETAK